MPLAPCCSKCYRGHSDCLSSRGHELVILRVKIGVSKFVRQISQAVSMEKLLNAQFLLSRDKKFNAVTADATVFCC
jgi:hypothetical protein